MLSEIYERVLGRDVDQIISDIEEDDLNAHLMQEALREEQDGEDVLPPRSS